MREIRKLLSLLLLELAVKVVPGGARRVSLSRLVVSYILEMKSLDFASKKLSDTIDANIINNLKAK